MVAVSDIAGGVYNGDGIDVAAAQALVESGKSVIELPDTDRVDGDAILEVDCDVLIPAALGEVITMDNQEKLKAEWIIEGANNPTTPDADAALYKRGVKIVPDILANGGGVTGSYFEWTQNIQQFTWEEDLFNERLERRMRKAVDETHEAASKYDVSMRHAAFAIAIERVAAASHMRGYM